MCEEAAVSIVEEYELEVDEIFSVAAEWMFAEVEVVSIGVAVPEDVMKVLGWTVLVTLLGRVVLVTLASGEVPEDTEEVPIDDKLMLVDFEICILFTPRWLDDVEADSVLGV
ncbi:hypothetical protein NDU88_004537 [Pleurodeles waltl]|uniref:Uncharacterized protein n=1 Tax=Pleurodeles waltl TaxID=8319 RepID=A0AAV7L703_PLEWA|nr:hypothetical protein NDU88_004537 [Pleurodeles waltl]